MKLYKVDSWKDFEPLHKKWWKKFGRTSTGCYTIRVYHTSLKSFEQSSLAGNTTTPWLVTSESRRFTSLSPASTTRRHFAMTSKVTWRDATSAWLWKRSSLTVTSSCYQYPLIDGRLYPWILSRVCQYLQIRKATAMTRSLSFLAG